MTTPARSFSCGSYAATARGEWLLDLMRRSPITTRLPEVRRAALRESCRAATSESALKHLFLDVMTGSQYERPHAHA